jgi:hypothetical protein
MCGKDPRSSDCRCNFMLFAFGDTYIRIISAGYEVAWPVLVQSSSDNFIVDNYDNDPNLMDQF